MTSLAPHDTIPTQYWTVGSLHSHNIARHVLPAADIVTLNANSPKSINCRGRSEQSHPWPVELAVLIRGVSPPFNLVGKFRSWTALRNLLVDNVQKLGRRARERPLQPYLQTFGVCAIESTEVVGMSMRRHRANNALPFYSKLSV